MKRIPCIFLLLALLTSNFYGCGSTSETKAEVPSSSETTAAAEETVSEAEEAAVTDDLPDLSLDGVTINTLIREEAKDEFAAEMDGDVIDAEVYNRNRTIEERFDCSMTYTIELGSWTYMSTFQEKIRGTVLANDSTFDIVTGQSNIVQPLNVEGVFVNLLDEDYIDLTKPYWVEAYTDGINLNGQVSTVCGDFAISSFSNANVIFFNKAVMDDHNMTYPYEDALNGTWTFDKLLGMSETVTNDINGDGQMNMDDLRGFCAYNNSIQPFFSSFGLNYTGVDSDGIRYILAPDERTVNGADRVNEFYHSNTFVNASSADFVLVGANTEPSMAQYFMEGKYLFMGMVLEGIEYLRDMEVDFGILPYPKYDEEQADYYTTILRRYTVAAVPISAEKSSNSALILEALGSVGYNDILPKYYEVALKGKYVRDESSSQVLDLIKSSLYLEFVDMYYADLGFSDFFASYVMNNSAGTYASSFESNRTVWETKLEKLYEAYNEG